MQIMQELPINKPNFFFKNKQDFSLTTHIVPHGPIHWYYRFIFSLSWSCTRFIERVTNGHVMVISTCFNFFFWILQLKVSWNVKHVLFNTVLFCNFTTFQHRLHKHFQTWQKVECHIAFWKEFYVGIFFLFWFIFHKLHAKLFINVQGTLCQEIVDV